MAPEPYPPFASADASGNWVGWEVELIDAVCTEAKLDCAITPTAWDGIIPALTTKKIDVIWNSMSITDERKKTIDFSDKYYNTPTAIIGAKDQKFGATPEDLKGKVIGVQVSTVHSAYAKKHFTEAAEIKEYQTQDEANQDLAAGRIDATQADAIALDAFLKTDQGKACCDLKGNGRRGRRGARPGRRRRPAQGRHRAQGQDQRRASRRSAPTASTTRSPRSTSTSTSTATEPQVNGRQCRRRSQPIADLACGLRAPACRRRAEHS